MTSHADDRCDYCGLPLASRWWRPPSTHASEGTVAEPAYCCVGCRIAASIAGEGGETGAARWALARLGLAIFFTMNVMAFTMALWSYEIYEAELGQTDRWTASLIELFRYACLLLSLPVLWLLGGTLWHDAWSQMRRGVFSTDLLLVLGIGASYVYSVLAVFRGYPHVYFEVGCVVLVMLTLGRWLEATGKLRTTAALDALEKLLPEQVRLDTIPERWVPRQLVAVGDTLRALPGERVPLDGVIVRGSATIDEQVITGESRPAIKESGDEVYAGTLNLDAELVVRATCAANEGSLRRLIDLVRAAREKKGHYQRLADRIAQAFLPLVSLISLAAAFYHGTRAGFDTGLMTGLSVLLIACPCALGLATPLAVWAALGTASRAQVLFRHGEALERLATVRAICFDKTGTLTIAEPKVERFLGDGDEREILSVAAAMATASLHSFSRAIELFVDESSGHVRRKGASDAVQQVRTLPGRGLVAQLGEAERSPAIYLGSWRLMQEQGLLPQGEIRLAIERALAGGESISCLGWEGVVRGVFKFREQLRPEARAAIEACRALGCELVMLTGDHQAYAHRIGQRLGLAVRAELLPEDKVHAVREVRQTLGQVAMIGDGINDAPALESSDVGVALACGTDLSRQSASVCLLSNDLRRLPWAIELSRRALRTIRFNLLWAFVYNVVGVGLAAAGWLNPVFAAVAMVGSSMMVIGNSLFLAQRDVPLAHVAEMEQQDAPAAEWEELVRA
ncbi:MAG: cation-translocating P-type ATPase [Pirellulales bacterium]|nr:cation-translocating P-type ATPase [Pirellulales bacterium]